MSEPVLRPEQEALLRILNAFIHARDCRFPQDFDAWWQLMTASMNQRVAPVVWHYLSLDADALARCPREVAGIWRNFAEQETAVQQARERSFLSLYQVLREGGLHPLVVKGLICRHLYPFPDLRQSCDEDVLLPGEESEEFDILTRACGFIRNEDTADEVHFHDPETQLHIEVHPDPLGTASAYAMHQNDVLRDVFDAPEEVRIGSAAVLTPEPGRNLFFLIMHQMKHFRSSGVGIRMLCDITAFKERYAGRIDRAWMREKLRSFGAESYVRSLEIIERACLGLPEDCALYEPDGRSAEDVLDLLLDMFAAGVHGTSSETRKLSTRITAAAMDGGDDGNGASLCKLLFPSREIMFGRYAWMHGRSCLLPAAYAARFAEFLFMTLRDRLRGQGGDADARWIALGKKRLELLRRYGVLDAVASAKEEVREKKGETR